MDPTTRYSGVVWVGAFPEAIARAAIRALYRACQARREVLKVAIVFCFSSRTGGETGLLPSGMNYTLFAMGGIEQRRGQGAVVPSVGTPLGIPGRQSECQAGAFALAHQSLATRFQGA